jgi:hypothetical protein
MPAPGPERYQPHHRLLSRGYGVYMIGASVIIASLSWLALHMLAPIAEDRSGSTEIPSFVVRCIASRAWTPLLSLPALLCGIGLLRMKRRSLALAVLGTAALLLPLVIVLYCFIALVGRMYTYQPL